jgi:O-antigen/teichoic acid export membrane protein
MAPLVSTLSLAMPFFALQIICSPATNALGKPGIYVRSSIAGALIMPLAFSIGIGWGIEGLARSWLVATPLLLIATLFFTLPEIGVRWRDLARSLMPSALAAFAMALVVWQAAHQLTWMAGPPRLGILVALGCAVYGGLLWIFSRSTLLELHSFVTKKQLPGAG